MTPCHVRGRGGEGREVSRLLFADDTLIFSEAYEDQLTFVCWLMWFEALSRLKINLDKCELIPVGRVNNIDVLADELDARWEASHPPIGVCLWMLTLSLWQFGMGLRSGTIRDWPYGKSDISPRMGESH